MLLGEIVGVLRHLVRDPAGVRGIHVSPCSTGLRGKNYV